MANPFGCITFCIYRGSGAVLKENEQYFAVLQLPEQSFRGAGALKTQRRPPSKMEWNALQTFSLTSPLPGDAKVILSLFQSNRVMADDKIGTTEVGLEQLHHGSPVNGEFQLRSRDGRDVATVALRINWDELPPELGGNGDSGDNGDGEGGQALRAAGDAHSSHAAGGVAPAARQLPPCKGEDFTIRVYFHKAKQLMSERNDKEFSAKGCCTIGRDVESTDVAKRTLEPVWDQEVTFTLHNVGESFWAQTITLSVVDTKGLLAQTIGSFDLDCGTVYRAPRHFLRNKWLVLRKSLDEEMVVGFLKVNIAVLNLKKDPFPEVDEDDDEEESENAIIANLMSTAGAAFEQVYLHCDVVRAQDLPQMDLGGTADPYVKLMFGKKSVQTANIQNTLAPVWNSVVQLPAVQPSLASTISVQLWDYDVGTSDDIIGTHRLQWESLRQYGEGHPISRGLPAHPATWINFYGHPRGEDSDFNRYYKKMAVGEVKGIDYRGRLLIRITGSPHRAPLAQEDISENVVKIHVSAEILMISMIPSSGRFKVRVSCGLFSATTKTRDAARMSGSGGQYCAYFGERLAFTAEFPVVVPTEPHHAPLDPQIPDVMFQLVEDPLLDIKSVISMPGKIKETTPYASTHFSAARVLRAYSDAANGRAASPFYTCKPLRLSIDPDKLKEGAYPPNPICQLSCGMSLLSFATPEPLTSVPTSATPRQWRSVIIDSEPMRKAIMDVFVYQARDVPAGDDNGLSDPFVRVAWANAVGQTTRRNETLNPTFNEAIRLEAETRPQFPDVVVELWDHDVIGRDTFLAKAVVPFASCLATDDSDRSEIQWVRKMTDSLGRRIDSCSVLVAFSMHLDPSKAPALKQKMFARKLGDKAVDRGLEIPPQHQLKTKMYTLTGSVLSLRNMRKFRLRDLQRPRCEIECAGLRTTIGSKDQPQGPNPTFKQSFSITMELPENPMFLPSLNIRVFDETVILGKAYIAATAIPLQNADGTGINERLSPDWHRRFVADIDQRVAAHAQMVEQRKKGLLVGGTSDAAQGGDSWDLVEVPSTGGPAAVKPAPGGRKVGFDLSSTSGDRRLQQQKSPLDAPLLQHQGDGEDSDAEELSEMGARPGHSAEPQRHKARTAEAVDTAIADALGDQIFDEARAAVKARVRAQQRMLEIDPVETDSDASSVAEEALWFDRFEPEATCMVVEPVNQVARLGKLQVPDPEHRTLEDVFGPFNDEFLELELFRGCGKDARRAGSVWCNFELQEAASGAVPTSKATVEPLPIRGREPIKFLARVYIVSCSNLAALDDGPLGKASDPYVILKLHGSGKSRDQVVLKCRDECKYQTLNPEFFMMKELEGDIAKHSTLTISVFDYDKVGFDEEIGSTDISLEDRWYSQRGYRCNLANGWGVGDGSYTESRLLINKLGHTCGSIELWVDMFDKTAPIPRPIDITPPPPVEVELRAIVWNTRDVELVDRSLAGEEMTDIYVRVFMDGMQHDVQNTDVHYRSLDGSGNFNWRMIFSVIFDPRTKTVVPLGEKKLKLLSLFSVRREQRRLRPLMHVQIFDNDLLPGTDDFIGEATLDLLSLRPTRSRRRRETLLDILGSDAKALCTCGVWPCNLCCGKKINSRLTLKQKQQQARVEMEAELMEQERCWNDVVFTKLAAMKELDPHMTKDEERHLRRKLKRAAKKNDLVNVFEPLLPRRPRVGAKQRAGLFTAPFGFKESEASPDSMETAKYWFAARGPCGGGRVGDVQMSFQLVRVDALEKDEALTAGKGRSDPNALPEPARPDSSFFWLSSPWKSAVHILWKNYKWYFFTILCIIVSALFVYVFTTTGVRIRAEKFFQ